MRLIEIPSWSNATLVELIWLFSGILAFTIASMRLVPLVRDLNLAKLIGEDDLCVIARGYLRRETVRMAQASCIIGIGIYSSITAPGVPGPARTTVVGLVITAALILISLLVAFQSYLDWSDRKEVQRIIKRSHDDS
jgi:hypothetical protein